MSENIINEFNDNLEEIITELKEENNIAKLDLIWLFSITLDKYSIQRYLNNHQNLLKLLKKIAIQLLTIKHGVRNRLDALNLFGDIKVRVFDRFNEIINRRRELFSTLSNNLNNIIRRNTSDIMKQFTRNKLHGNLDLLSLISRLNELSVEIESQYKIPINETEYLKNITFLENSYPNPGDFYFSKGDQYLEIKRLCMGTLSYLANHVLNKEYSVLNVEFQITYKLTNSIANQMTNPSLTANRKHFFDFWTIGDELYKYGIGYWYPYFTTMNRVKREIKLNFIIPVFIFELINEIDLPEIRDFQEKLLSFDNTQATVGVVIGSEITHDQIKDYVAENLDIFGDGLRLLSKEYNTGDVGNIDVLFQNEDDDFLVIEVKKSIARYEPVGQILNYINWVKENLVEGNKVVRGIIICESIHPQLISAFKEANNPNISIWTYERTSDGFNFEKTREIEGKLCPFCNTFCSPRARTCPNCGDPF